MKSDRLVVISALSTAMLFTGACNDHVFQRVTPLRSDSNFVDRKIDVDRAVDILFVIDNSYSMAEEQENLARNISSSDDPSSPCDAVGFAALKQYLDDNPGMSQTEWGAAQQDTYAGCGFIERLQLYDNKFRVGVVTTDMNDCDRNTWTPERGTVPQRGCLQSSAEEPELTVLSWDTPDLAGRLANIIRNVGISGSPYEKGLEAARHFLTPGHSTPISGSCDQQRSCAGDLDAFLRRTELNAHGEEIETKLAILFLTDEEDCSDGGRLIEEYGNEIDTDHCYERPDLLTPPEEFVRFFKGIKSRPELVSMAVIAGLHDSGVGMRPSGCKLLGGQSTNACDLSRGNSISTCTDLLSSGQPQCVCHGHIDGVEDTNCCQADGAYRYVAVAEGMSSYKLDTLCSASFRDTMIEIADLLLEINRVNLSEPVATAEDIVVSIKGERWGGQWVDMPYYDRARGEPVDGGWNLNEDNDVIRFWLDWVPEPGDELQVMYRGL